MKMMWAVVLAGAFFLGLVACDLQKIGNQATARAVAVSTVLSTPAVEIKAGALAGIDASIPTFDAGITIDAGLLEDAGVTIPPQNVVLVFFGQRQGEGLDLAPTPTTGANVTLTEKGGATWPLTDQGAGNYTLTGDAGFAYKDNATYTFNIASGGSTYVAEVERVPAQERIPRFHDAPGYIEINAGDAVTFLRPEPTSGQQRNLGFINVFPVDKSGSQGNTTYTNIPKTPLAFLKLIVAPDDWLQSSVTIPGTAFPEKDKNYVIILQSAKLGGPKSDNLFSGSAILAGTADVGIVKTRP